MEEQQKSSIVFSAGRLDGPSTRYMGILGGMPPWGPWPGEIPNVPAAVMKGGRESQQENHALRKRGRKGIAAQRTGVENKNLFEGGNAQTWIG